MQPPIVHRNSLVPSKSLECKKYIRNQYKSYYGGKFLAIVLFVMQHNVDVVLCVINIIAQLEHDNQQKRNSVTEVYF